MGLFDRFFQTENISSKQSNGTQEVVDAVYRLLNTRSPLSSTQCASLTRRSVVDYGLPDFIHLSPQSRSDAEKLAALVRSTIASHEPRISIHDVSVEAPRLRRDVVRVIISGQVLVEGKARYVCFAVVVGENVAAD